MNDVRAVEIGDRLYQIDAWMEGHPERLACYLFDTPERVLIEVGPSATLGHLIEALDELGVDDLAIFVVTHIHLDHAGGAGQMAKRYPNAKVGVHSRGARHLANPERLWASAIQVFGEEWLTSVWGPIEPVDPERLVILDEGDRVSLGNGRFLDVMYTPGHAKHHVVYQDSDGGGMFVGDALGLCYPHGHFVQPVTPPPDFDPDVQIAQMGRMLDRRPSFLAFAHFGPRYDVETTLIEAEERLREWVQAVSTFAGMSTEAAGERLRLWTADKYRGFGYSEDAIASYAEKTNWPMQAAGIRRWLAQRAG
ncbi:hydroxyacylglutathione hydrolase [bacterium BMS3Abin02]|nr:hydroxyacylglutathione hydrolase [bacterium BMS3Abin02]HDH25919.1 MBL fold metallo-hydrolase [Actinomycetota bacterium]HDL50182.1 MBL fold metallo-hydrolase [Actinomycetota bacterium]